MAEAKAEIHYKLWTEWAATKISEHRITHPIPVPKGGVSTIKPAPAKQAKKQIPSPEVPKEEETAKEAPNT